MKFRSKMIRENRSLRSRFDRFILILLLLISFVVLFSNLQSYSFWQKYRDSFVLYDDLSLFYEQVEMMNFRMKNFLYSNYILELQQFNDHYSLAMEAVGRLKTHENPELSFRFSLLENMLLTYKDSSRVSPYSGQGQQNQLVYDKLNRLAYLIDETYPQYARLIASEMNREKEGMLREWQSQLGFTLVVFFFLVLGALVFSIHSVRSITSPIEKLILNINRIKSGEFELKNVHSDSHEIKVLLESFEEMADELQAYINEIQEKSRIEKQLIENEKLLAETRLNVLQGQMNPHFLFNTLSLISKMAYVEGAEKTSDLMVKTASMLRYSLDMGGKVSTLEQEVVCVENYIQIQERRAGDRIQFRLEQDDHFKRTPIPGMILQPLVENCVIHGVKDLVKDAEIFVSLRKSLDHVDLVIRDNGSGFPAEVLDQFRNNRLSPDSTSIGLSNVSERLKLFYKDDFSMTLANESGAVIRIRIPLEKEV